MNEKSPAELAREAQQRVERHTQRKAPSPRLKPPAHHFVRSDAGRRRLAITMAGIMLLVAAGLGFVTAAGIFAQAGSTRPPVLPSQAVEVAGEVTDTTGTPLPDAVVRITNLTNESRTNADGWYFLGSLEPGTYRLEASKPGYQTLQRTVVLSPAFPREVDFALPAGNGTVEGPSDRVPTYSDPTAGVLILALAVGLCSAMATVGGVSALLHRHYLLAVAGAAAGVLTVGFFVGSTLAVMALAILGSLKTGFLEAQRHRIPWEGKLKDEGSPDEPAR